jgi:hypothetical protein
MSSERKPRGDLLLKLQQRRATIAGDVSRVTLTQRTGKNARV